MRWLRKSVVAVTSTVRLTFSRSVMVTRHVRAATATECRIFAFCSPPFMAHSQVNLGGVSLTPSCAAVLLCLAIHRERHEPIGLAVLELDNFVASRTSWPHRIGLSGFCSIAAYWRPPTTKDTVLRPCFRVRRTGSHLRSSSTASALIIARFARLGSKVREPSSHNWTLSFPICPQLSSGGDGIGWGA